MLNVPKNAARIITLALGMATAGCQQDTKPEARFAASDSGQGVVAVLPNSYVNLDLPTVVIDHGITSISGAVRRKPGIRWALSGRVDIEFISPDGERLDAIPALITPRAIPMDSNSASIYSTNYGYVPPAGSTVRVHYVDADTQAREDLEGTEFNDGNVAGGVHAASGHGAAGPSHYAPHNGGGGMGGGFGFH